MGVGKRNFGLDILRAAAITGVFLSHELKLPIAGANMFANLGSGVELFFVLSGFLIGGICFRSLRDNNLTLWNLWRSRWWRTLPPYAAGILFYLAIRPFHPPFGPLPWYYGVFLQNYLGVAGFGVSWSLCIEEHFYLCLPMVLLLSVRWAGLKSLRYLLPALFPVSLILRLATYWLTGGVPAQWFYLTHLHFEGLIVGVWMSYLLVFERPVFDRLRTWCRWLLPIPLVLVLVLPFWNPQPLLFDLFLFMLYALGYAAWLRYIYDFRWEPVSRAGMLVRWCVTGTALCSYSIYLTHTTFDPWLRAMLEPMLTRGAFRSAVVLVATWTVGVMFYFLVERPTIISRDRYLKRAAPASAVKAVASQCLTGK
jgi:peptidoglycan/LPS O-acetylase OafA/YrhL